MPHLGFAAASLSLRSRFPARVDRAWPANHSHVALIGALAETISVRLSPLGARFERALEPDVAGRVLTAFNLAGIRPPAVLNRSV